MLYNQPNYLDLYNSEHGGPAVTALLVQLLNLSAMTACTTGGVTAGAV